MAARTHNRSRRPKQDWSDPALAGRTFGPYTLVAYAGTDGHRSWWECRCACGRTVKVRADKLPAATGCRCRKHAFHGKTRTREYNVWRCMLARCGNANLPHHRHYGGRGIVVCDRWQDFAAFLADVGPAPSPKHSLDRHPDKNGPYAPGNVRWATQREQMRNMRRNRLLTFGGETHCLAEWAELRGLAWKTLAGRLDRGWEIGRALDTPAKPR